MLSVTATASNFSAGEAESGQTQGLLTYQPRQIDEFQDLDSKNKVDSILRATPKVDL